MRDILSTLKYLNSYVQVSYIYHNMIFYTILVIG